MTSHIRRTARTAAIFGTGIALVAASTLLATPAYADSDDIDVIKSASVATALAGDTVTYTVETRGVTSVIFGGGDTSVTISDSLPPYMTYVAGTSQVTFNDAQLGNAFDAVSASGGYSNGTGWAGSWGESNDDGAAATGDVRINDGFLDDRLYLRDSDGDSPSITREVDLPGTLRAVLLSFTVLGNALESDDTMEAQLSYDGGVTWPDTLELVGGSLPILATLSAEGLAAPSLHVRFVVTGGTNGTGFLNNERFSVGGISLTYMADAASTTYTDVGDPSGPLSAGPWDLGYGDTLVLTYDAVIDSVIPDATTELTNTATVTSDDDPTGEVAQSTVALTRVPDLDIVTTHSAALSIGAPVDVTAVVSHSAASDGAPVCAFELHADVSAPTAFTYVSGDTDTDGCLDYGESWTFTKSMTSATSASGVHSVALRGVGTDPHSAPFEAVDSLTFTVVLAESGPNDVSGMAVTSAGLALLGFGLLVSTRRRPV